MYLLNDPPKFFFFFFTYEYQILRWFQIHGHNWKKVYTEKVICKLVVKKRTYRYSNFEHFFAYNFFVS